MHWKHRRLKKLKLIGKVRHTTKFELLKLPKYRYHKTRVLSKLSVYENNHFLKSFSREVRLMKCTTKSMEYQYKT